MPGLDDLISKIPMDQLASRLGVDQQTAERATRTAVPALVQGMHENAKDPARAASLEKAVGKHRRRGRKGVPRPDEVDTSDGESIVRNVFGGNTDSVVSKLGETEGSGGSGLMSKVLPMVAPMVLSHLADQEDSSGGGIASMLGGMMGAGSQSSSSGIASMLGGLLGGGRS